MFIIYALCYYLSSGKTLKYLLKTYIWNFCYILIWSYIDRIENHCPFPSGVWNELFFTYTMATSNPAMDFFFEK